MKKAFLSVFLMGCSVAASEGTGAGSGDYTGSSGGSSGVTSGTSAGAGTTSAATSGSGGAAGVLTAGVWDDNLNYDFFGKYVAAHHGIPGDPAFSAAERDASHAEFAARSPHTKIDAALVIDTTGSMGDELQYLTAEFSNITSAISAKYPGADQRWALVLYRDRPDTDPGDAYVVRSFDFTGSPAAFTTILSQQSASGGGDYPEAPELGVGQLAQLSWRSDPSVARVAFWVGDAPQHDSRGPDMHQAIMSAHGAGIHIYPVSASGADSLLELSMRSAAQISGGRYLFLTDDSGVGDPHKIPEIPCYYVTKLERALVRVASMEISGTYIGPDSSDVIRTSGSPSPTGKCATQDGQTVDIF